MSIKRSVDNRSIDNKPTDDGSIDEHSRAAIEAVLNAHPVVLFMKGNRSQPQCGFSARTAGILDTLLVDYATVDVLKDAALREAIKRYGQWPTIPQLYVDGELIGGCDIVGQLFDSGELYAVLDVEQPEAAAPRVGCSDAALGAIRNALEQEAGAALLLQISARWDTRLDLGPPREQAVRVDMCGVPLYMDPSTAQRADGLHIDLIDTLHGRSLHFDNPNAPPPVQAMSVVELKRRLDADLKLRLLDVRSPAERQAAHIAAAVALDEATETEVRSLPQDTPLVFHCHTGVRSRAAAERFRLLGFSNVYNLEGGIEAWSVEIDSSVPRY